MEKRTYKKVMDVPTEMLITEPVLVDQIKDRVKMELIDGLVGLVTSGNEYIISLSDIIETHVDETLKVCGISGDDATVLYIEVMHRLARLGIVTEQVKYECGCALGRTGRRTSDGRI